MHTATFLQMEARGAVQVVTITRPPAGALNHALLKEFLRLLPALRAARAVVVTGQGRFFSAGLDLLEVFSYEPPEDMAFAAAFDEAVTSLLSLEVPLVAAVNGHAIAGGCVLAATADFRLLADGDAKLGLTEIQVGVPFPTSALEAVRCRCAGPHLHEVLQRGLTYGPREALQRNLVDEVVPAGELLDRALALAEELGGRPRVAFASTKRALRAEHLARIQAARQGGLDPVWTQWRTPEVLAHMAAYRQRALKKG